MNKFKIIVLLTFCFNFTLIADDFAIKAVMGTMMFFLSLSTYVNGMDTPNTG